MLTNLIFYLLTISSFTYNKVGNGGCRTNNINVPSIDFFHVSSQQLCEDKCSLNINCTGIEWIKYTRYKINCHLQGSNDIQDSSNLSDNIICLKKIDSGSTYRTRYSTTGILQFTLYPKTTPSTSSTTSLSSSTTPLSSSTTPLSSSTTPLSSSTTPLSSSTTPLSSQHNSLFTLYPPTTPLTSSTTPLSSSTTPLTATTTQLTSSTTPLTASTTPLSSQHTSLFTLHSPTTTSNKIITTNKFTQSNKFTSSTKIEVSGLEESGSGLDDIEEINEIVLRKSLFNGYSMSERPVTNFSSNIKLTYGIEIKSLEYFDQKGENIKFNLWLTQTWKDEYLKWNKKDYNYNYLNIYSDQIWIPDLELYNAAAAPKIYDTNGGLKLYSDGTILWVRPTTYSFSCKLDLNMFPFDEQRCTMTFGSWKYSANFLDLRPFKDHPKFKNISVDAKFSHNEWNIVNTYVDHEDIEYLCCPDELWPNSFYTIVLKRNYTKYLVVIAMTLLITIASLVILTFSMKNYTRTFVLVFLPLSIIWLQVYISSKIPVIEYYTLMEKILITCFIITILNAMESGFIFIIINEKFECLNIFYNKIINSKIKNYKINNIKIIHNSKNNNLDIYKNLYKHLLWLDNCYRILVISCFIITISIFMRPK